MKHLKLFFALFAMLALGVGNAWGVEVTISYKDIPDGYTATTGTSGSFTKTVSATNDLTISYAGINTKSKATAAAHAYGYAMFLKNYGYIYSSSAPSGFYPSKVVVKFGSQTGTSGKAGISFGTNVLSTRNSNVTGAVSKSGTCSLENSDKTKLHWNFSTTSANVQVASVTVTYTSIGADETTYSVTLNQPSTGGTIEADKDEAAKGATVTLTATPDEGYKFGAWDVKDASSNSVSVDANGQFTMPESNVTVTASFVAKTQYTIKWNVAEGNVADTQVYEGDALSTLPTADNCSSGKVFVGWTEATSVNADGSGLVLAKSTDVPAGNKEYNAVYATLSGSADKVDNLDLSLTGASGSTYSSWSEKKSVSDAVYAGNSAGSNDAIQLRKSSDSQAKSGIITTTSGGKAKKVVVTWNSNTASGRTLNVYGSNSAYSSVDNLYTDATAGTLIGTIVNGTSTELDITGDYEYIGMRSNASAMYLDKIQITWSASSASDYSLDCGTNNTPFLTVTETAIDFGTVAQNETATETFTVTGGYLAEDVALTISGTDASFFSVSPATITKADDVEETVTVTYNPTATGDHTANLTIKTGEITKTVALSGTVLAPGKWALVTDASQLNLGDEIIIVAADANVALSTTQNTNNRGQAAIVKVGNTVNAGDDVQILTLGQGTVENTFAFSTGDGYLYAAGTNSSNHLKTNTTLDARGSWAITIDNATGVATIKAQDSNTKRNWLRYNATNNPPIFSCYESGQKDVCVYRNTDVIAAPIISGNVDFTTETIVTITAQSGLTVYYTTNGNTPDKTATQYSAPFTISATTTVKAIAYDATEKASNVAEKTFTKHDLVNVATAMALAKDEIAYFAEFEVVKVVTGKGNIYIKDASGHGLIYDNTLAGELKDGDRVQGFVGISSPYNGLPEAKPYNVTYEDLTITAGTPAEPYDFTSTAIAETDINKYIVFQNVEITENTDMSTNPTLTIGGNSVKFYNQFSVSKTLEAGKIYDIYGFVAVYEKDGNRNLQAYFYEAAQDGEVIQKYTVTYNAGGATGTVPVDNAEYSEGAQVYLKSATSLTYEGYEYKGWKVTDANGTEIPVSSNKFNMPASNVTVTAQWEEIVVTPKKDFSEGYWVLVTEAGELNADDYIVIAAAEEDLAMKSYESGNNCGQIEITKSANLLIWNENVGVFQLLASGSNYTIQDVNTKDYLYAAGSGSNNYLKANDEVPADATMVQYVWTISFTDGVPTVKATSDNRNTLMYNTGSNLFSCYSSGQKAIALYKYVTELPTIELNSDDNSTIITANAGKTVNVKLNRSFTAGDGYYTLCLPFNIAASEIGTAYTLGAITKHVSGEEGGININLTSVSTIEAGVPYLVLPNTLTNPVFENVTIVNTEGSNYTVTGAGVKVTFTGIINGVGEQTNGSTEYYIGDNGYLYNGTVDKLGLRAFFTITDEAGNPTKVRARVVAGENVETGIEDIFSTDAPVKVIENGQLIIIRDGVKYNVQGQKL